MATVPTPFDWTAGAVPTASQLDAGVRDVETFLLNPPHATAYHSVDRTLTTATWTLAIFDSEVEDNDGIHSTASNTSRLTCQTPGLYLVTANVFFAGNATGGRGINITKNGAGTRGATSSAISDGFTPGVANTNQLVSATCEVRMAATDHLELFLFQGSGGNLSYIGGASGTKFSMRWVAA